LLCSLVERILGVKTVSGKALFVIPKLFEDLHWMSGNGKILNRVRNDVER